ncbi:MAG: glycosyltransferase [Prevotella sp.]|nr:glycosyltransferase [Prevotella sp.]MCM1075522.1 glycosyltransferase [Ruminococcus sp.]
MYNGKRTLKRCAKSILTQSMCDFEWIIIDDKSTDKTLSLCQEFQKKDSRIRVLQNKQNCGVAASRSNALKLCKGDYVMFVDADDALAEDALQSIYKIIFPKMEHDVYVCDSLLFVPKLHLKVNFYKSSDSELFKSNIMVQGCDAAKAMLANEGLTPNVWDKIYRREIITNIASSFTHLKIGEDYVLNYKILISAESIERINAATYLWSYNGLGKKYYLQHWFEYVKAIDYLFNEVNNISHLQALCKNYLQCLRESCVQHILHNYKKPAIRDFLYKGVQHEVIKYMPDKYSDLTIGFTVDDFYKWSQLQLRNHKKYYIFTQILDFLS